VGSDGKWSLTPASDLPLGNYNFVATQADEAGNVSAGSSPYGLGIGSAVLKFEDFNAMADQQLPPGTIVMTPNGIKITSVSTDRWISTIRPNLNLEDKQNCLLVAGKTVTRLDLPEGASDIQYRVFALNSLRSFAEYYDADGTLLGSRFLTRGPNGEALIQSFVAPPGKAIAYMVIDMTDEIDGGALLDNIQWSTVVVPSTFDLASTDELAELGEEVQALSSATQAYTDSDDTLIARLGFADRLEGGAGNDTFMKVGTGDTVHGGTGDDTIRISSGDFARLDGGLGIDTLVMDGTAMHIDLSALGAKVQGFEKFDLGAGGNTLALSAQDLLAGGARDMVTADGKVQMLVNGANGDVNLLGGNDDGWTLGNAATVGGVTYSVYTNLAGTAELLVEDKVHVTIL